MAKTPSSARLTARGGTRAALLAHIDAPDAGSAAQVKDPRVMGVEQRGTVEFVVARDQKELVENIQPLLFGLCTASVV